MLMLASVATAISLSSSATIFALVKRKKNESLNLTIDCDMVLPQSVIEHPVAYHFERLK
jgi:hypothetical protein